MFYYIDHKPSNTLLFSNKWSNIAALYDDMYRILVVVGAKNIDEIVVIGRGSTFKIEYDYDNKPRLIYNSKHFYTDLENKNVYMMPAIIYEPLIPVLEDHELVAILGEINAK